MGRIKEYGLEDLAKAQKIFNEIMRNKLENGTVTLETLSIARDNDLIKQNLEERNDPFALKQVNEISDANAGGLGEEALVDIDAYLRKQKQTVEMDSTSIRQVALAKAMKAEHWDMAEKIKQNQFDKNMLTDYIHSKLLPTENSVMHRILQDYETEDSINEDERAKLFLKEKQEHDDIGMELEENEV